MIRACTRLGVICIRRRKNASRMSKCGALASSVMTCDSSSRTDHQSGVIAESHTEALKCKYVSHFFFITFYANSTRNWWIFFRISFFVILYSLAWRTHRFQNYYHFRNIRDSTRVKFIFKSSRNSCRFPRPDNHARMKMRGSITERVYPETVFQ